MSDATVTYTKQGLAKLGVKALRGLPEADGAQHLTKAELIQHILNMHAEDEQPAPETDTLKVVVSPSYRFTTFMLSGVVFQKRHPTEINANSDLADAVRNTDELLILQ